METIYEFIEEHRQKLQKLIHSQTQNCNIDDDEIELWINNDEDLYNWCRDCGVDI